MSSGRLVAREPVDARLAAAVARRRLAVEERRRLAASPSRPRPTSSERERPRPRRRRAAARRGAATADGHEQREERQHEDQVPRLRRGDSLRAARARNTNAGTPTAHAASTRRAAALRAQQQHARRARRAEHDAATPSGQPAREVAGDAAEVVEHARPGRRASRRRRRRRRRSGRRARGRCSQNGIPSTATAANADDRLAQPLARQQHVEPLRGEHERAVRDASRRGEDRERPERPAPRAAALERAQQREVRERAREAGRGSTCAP